VPSRFNPTIQQSAESGEISKAICAIPITHGTSYGCLWLAKTSSTPAVSIAQPFEMPERRSEAEDAGGDQPMNLQTSENENGGRGFP
jgi:hypothetical protein